MLIFYNSLPTIKLMPASEQLYKHTKAVS